MSEHPKDKQPGPESEKADESTNGLPEGPRRWDDEIPTDEEGRPANQYGDVPTPTEAFEREFKELKRPQGEDGEQPQ